MQLRIIRNYHGFACQEYLGGVTSFIAILILVFYFEGRCSSRWKGHSPARATVLFQNTWGVTRMIDGPPNDTGDKLAVSVDFNRIIAAAININPGWFFAWAARPAHHR